VEDEGATLSAEAWRAPPGEELRVLPLSLVSARSDQPRRGSRGKALQELARSVAAVGVLQPIRVRRRGERYEIVSGERRWTAARLAGLTEIPAVVVDRDDDTALIEALIENVQREDLGLVDRAEAIRRVRSSLGLSSWEAVAERLGVSRGHLHRLLAITRLPESMREDPRFTSLTEKHVRALRRLQDRPEAQRQLWEEVHASAMSGEQALATAAALLHAEDDPSEATTAALRAAADALIGAVSQAHGSGVNVRVELLRVRSRIDELLGAAGASPPAICLRTGGAAPKEDAG